MSVALQKYVALSFVIGVFYNSASLWAMEGTLQAAQESLERAMQMAQESIGQVYSNLQWSESAPQMAQESLGQVAQQDPSTQTRRQKYIQETAENWAWNYYKRLRTSSPKSIAQLYSTIQDELNSASPDLRAATEKCFVESKEKYIKKLGELIWEVRFYPSLCNGTEITEYFDYSIYTCRGCFSETKRAGEHIKSSDSLWLSPAAFSFAKFLEEFVDRMATRR